MWGSLVVVLWTSLFTVVVPMVVRLLIGLGIGFVTYSGLDLVMDQAQDYIFDNFTGMPSLALSLARIAGIEQGIHIFFAAWSAHITIKVSMGLLERYRARPATLRA